CAREFRGYSGYSPYNRFDVW
nr:immunoglobulin heavy chain junction region [Macaca mulatta]MOW33401.1 immunoglobulin heavy chain junction region [Macaca mulatta]